MELEYINEKIGRKIRDLRNRNGLTQQELADRTELTKGFISQLERGQVSPSVVTLLDLIECLGTTAADFFKETEEEQVVFSEQYSVDCPHCSALSNGTAPGGGAAASEPRRR